MGEKTKESLAVTVEENSISQAVVAKEDNILQTAEVEKDAIPQKENKIKKLANKIAANAQDTVLNKLDKNKNGKLDIQDFAVDQEQLNEIKENVQEFTVKTGNSIKLKAIQLNEKIKKSQKDFDLKILRPVFLEEFLFINNCINETTSPHILPNMICIVDRDSKRDENIVCHGAIGYRNTVKGIPILNIYEDSVNDLELHFCPNITKTIYYRDPFREYTYIGLDDYFGYMEKARVSELEHIAESLGAKHVKITLKEEKKTFVAKNKKLDAKVKPVGSASAEISMENKEYSVVSICANTVFSGSNTPIEPQLVYFKNDHDIKALVAMRMKKGTGNEITSKTYQLNCKQTSGIKEKAAAEIDSILNSMKCTGNGSISSEVQREGRIILEYSIDF